MKISTYSIIFFVFIISLTKANAQDLSGIYCDGIKADSINCWSFKEMKLVFPIKDREKWKKYDRIQLGWRFDNQYDCKLSFYPENIDDYLLPGSDYAVWTVMKNPATDAFLFEFNGRSDYFRRQNFGAYQKACRTCDGLEPYSRFFNLVIIGSSVIGYEDDGTGSLTKKYGNGVILYKSESIPLYTESVGVFSSPGSAKTLSNPDCKISGEKIDLLTVPAGGYVNNLELIMGNANSSPIASNVEKTVVTTSSARVVSQLNPLDKTKANYFADKDSNGKMMREGYKNNGKYHGEVREYTNGVLEQIAVYSNDVQDGLFLQYDGKGKLQIEASYTNGQLNGAFKTYNNGILISTKTYVNGKEN